MANFGCALRASKEEAQRMIAEAVAKSSNLAEAMECVGAMYGIPSSNILVDDDLKSVKVINDTIICPSNVGASNNTNTVIRSISSLLDQISSRIDEKLNGLQIGNINNGQFNDSVLAKSDPSKGKIVATYKDSDGEPVIVYDSGIIDASNTPAGRQKAAELRASGNIPARDPLEKREPSYFTDEDDVMNGVPDIQSQPTPPTPPPTPTPNTPQMDQLKLTQPPMNTPNGIVEYSISDMIGESEYFIDAMSRFGGTSRLGTTIFTTQGYERILPDMNVVQEAVDVNTSTKMADLKHMKFDNKNLIKAINLLNKARAEQSNVKNVKDLDISRLINNPDYKAAISAIERQFDCHLNIRWYDLGPGYGDMMNVATVPTGIFDQIGVGKEITHKITISKSKGFQLGGSGVDVHVLGKVFDMLIPKEQDLFGQGFISVILHEMFHNIVAILRFDNVEFTIVTKCAIENAIKCRNPKRRKEIVEKYVDCVNDQLKGKLSRVARRMIVRRLLGAIATESDDRLRDEYLKAANEANLKTSTTLTPDDRLNADATRMDKSAKKLERRVKGYKHRGNVWLVLGCVFSAIGLISSIVSIGHPVAVAASLSVALAGGGTIVVGGIDKHIWNNYKKICSTYEDSRKVEEYYCDLFASMYQLPPHFFLLGKYRANDVSKETLERYAKSESNLMRKHDMISDKLLHELETGCYPTDSERIWSSVTVAKKLLETGKCDPAVKRYLEWILSGDSQILDVGIEDNYNYHNFSPDEAKDLDKHLNNIASNKNIKVTEAAIDALTDTSEFVEWIKEGMEYSEEEKDYMEYFDLIDSYDKFIQEAQTMTSINATGYKGESTLKRILLAIPRLIGKLIQIVAKVIEKLSNRVMVGILKMFTPDKQYVIDYNLPGYASAIELSLTGLKRVHAELSDADDFNEFGKVCAKLTTAGVFKDERTSGFITNKTKGFEALENPHGFTVTTHVSGKDYVVYGRDIVKCVDRILKAHEEAKPIINRINDIIKRFNDSNPEWINDTESENAKGIQALYQWLSLKIADEKIILEIARGLQRVAYDSKNPNKNKLEGRVITGVGVSGPGKYESQALTDVGVDIVKKYKG